MRKPFPALRKHYRQRFGIAARRVGVRMEVPGITRLALYGVIAALLLALAYGVFLYGRSSATGDAQRWQAELTELKARLQLLEEESAAAQENARVSTTRLQVEQATVEQLSSQIKQLQRENLALKDELHAVEVVFSAGGPGPALRLPRLQVTSLGGGRFRYQGLLVFPGNGKAAKAIVAEGRFELRYRRSGKDATIAYPDEASPPIRLTLKHFLRLEGQFQLPEGAELRSGELRFSVEGKPAAKKAFTL